jgi:hypothetical protein
MIYHHRGRKRLQLMARGKEKRKKKKKRKKLLVEDTNPKQITHTHIEIDDLPFLQWEEEVAADS